MKRVLRYSAYLFIGALLAGMATVRVRTETIANRASYIFSDSAVRFMAPPGLDIPTRLAGAETALLLYREVPDSHRILEMMPIGGAAFSEPILRGRMWEPGARNEAIAGEAFSLGERIEAGGWEYTIVGIVGYGRIMSVSREYVFIPMRTDGEDAEGAYVLDGAPEAVEAAFEAMQSWGEIAKMPTMEYGVHEVFRDRESADSFDMMMSAVLAVLIALEVFFSTSEQRKNMAVYALAGAPRRVVYWACFKEALAMRWLLLAAGLCLAVLGGIAALREALWILLASSVWMALVFSACFYLSRGAMSGERMLETAL